MEEEQERQQQQPLHRAVVVGIERLTNRCYREQRQKLFVNGYGDYVERPIDRRSIQHLVDFIDR
jgi:hypothetical protein